MPPSANAPRQSIIVDQHRSNVLVRYMAQDDTGQSKRASRLIEDECGVATSGFISLVVLVELVSVSERCYGATPVEVANMVRLILGIRQLVVQDAEVVWKSLRLFESSKADSRMLWLNVWRVPRDVRP